MLPLTPEKAYSRATAACSRREYCRADWARKFAEGGLAAEASAALLDRLAAEGYVDDRRFARAFVHDKVGSGQWGRLKAACALRARGVDSEAAAEALAAVDEEAYREGLRRLLERKARTLPPLDARLRRLRLLRYAAGRGFEAALAAALLGGEDD